MHFYIGVILRAKVVYYANRVFVLSVLVETQRDKDWTCMTSPCKNGGTCKPGISKCVCRLGYVGDYCECKMTASLRSFNELTVISNPL